MDLYGAHSRSLPQKAIIVAAELAFVAASWSLLFGAWGQEVARWLDWPGAADPVRRGMILGFNVVVFARITFMMLVMLQRRIPAGETVSIPLAFATYFVGFAVFTLRTASPPGALFWAGVALFVVGSVLNTGGELGRFFFKRQPENKGRLYTGGLFSLSRHINYFGDILWVAGYALVTGNPWAGIVPAALFVFFAFFNAPMLDRHLAEHYGVEYARYARTTKSLVPFVY